MLLTSVCGVNLCPVMDSRVRTLYKIDTQPEGPAQARRIIAEELSTVLSPSELDDVKLMVSELVTNGIVHGRLEGNDVPVLLDGASTEASVAQCSTMDRDLQTGQVSTTAEAGAYGWSSNCPTAGGCKCRHGAPKYGSNAIADEVLPRAGGPPCILAPRIPAAKSNEMTRAPVPRHRRGRGRTVFLWPPPSDRGNRQLTDASSPLSVISRKRASARRRIRETCICETPISSAI